MMKSGHWQAFVLAASALGILHAPVTAAAAEPMGEELVEEIRRLKERVAALEAHQARHVLDPPEAEDTKENVLRDADRRSQPLPFEPTGGHDEDGFFLRSEDGNFTLRPVIQFQFRGVTTYREDAGGEGSDTESGFEVRRLELSFEGNAFTPNLTYEFKWITERNGGGLVAEDAWVNYTFADPFSVTLGQFRDPVFHEELVSSKYLLAADRSLANAVLGSQTGFVQGVMLVYGNKDTPLHAAAAFHDGAGSINTPFLDSEGEPDFVENFGLAGRAEYKLYGEWKRYKDFTAKGTDRDLLVVGAATDWTQGENTDVFFLTADAQWETPGGLGAYAALLGNYYDFRNVATAGSRFDWGGIVQVAYLITPQWEGFGRYDFLRLDRDPSAGGNDTFHEVTVGVNYYLGPDGSFGHRAKFTLDLTYLPDGAPADATGLGVLASEHDEWVLRGQFQLLL